MQELMEDIAAEYNFSKEIPLHLLLDMAQPQWLLLKG